MALPNLPIEWLRAFVAVAEKASFTAAGQMLAATQSTISVRLRKLEDRVGRRLVERNPHAVALTPFGASFLVDARRLLRLHDETVERATIPRANREFSLAISDHVVGGLLPEVLSRLQRDQPSVELAVTVDMSVAIFAAFDAGRYDAVIGRSGDSRATGRLLFADPLTWVAAAPFSWDRYTPLPLVALAAPCAIRETTERVLDAHGIVWRTAFVGTGVAAVQAAASAGLGVACLGARNVPQDCRRVGTAFGLPPLPIDHVVMRDQGTMPRVAAVVGDVFERLGTSA
ncbi:MAG: LysR substrate-binding domain-containing protein [Pseudomonadota bacterium]